jgi:hypothetical protein
MTVVAWALRAGFRLVEVIQFQTFRIVAAARVVSTE